MHLTGGVSGAHNSFERPGSGRPDGRRDRAREGAQNRARCPPSRSHNALFWINLDTVGSQCTQIRSATGPGG